ncbi:MAG: hypothetical protein LBP87_00540, partial [Planctomycetaceae bacterium]|nr:hypothetical protein [Planctomycetaceae bacterium]
SISPYEKKGHVYRLHNKIICFSYKMGKTQRRETATEISLLRLGATRFVDRFIPTNESGALHILICNAELYP